MTSVYGRLGFNSSDPVVNNTVHVYSANVTNKMNLMPTMVKSWQQDDIANSNTSGYFVNPVANVTSTIKTTSNTLLQLLNNTTGTTIAITNALQSVNTTANLIYSTIADNYLYITNRQSNVSEVGSDNSTPHYKIATGMGKILSYLTYQTDGVQNNSPIMGNFTSITIGNTLNSLSNTYVAIAANVANSISANVSNIDLTSALSLDSTANQIANLMSYYPAQDTQFFRNSQNVVSDYATVIQFDQIGFTEKELLNNYIGTPKLISRLNS